MTWGTARSSVGKIKTTFNSAKIMQRYNRRIVKEKQNYGVGTEHNRYALNFECLPALVGAGFTG